MQNSNVAAPNYLPMMPPGGGPRPGGGMMGKGGGRPGGAPGMGGKGGGMRPANPPRLPSVIGGGFTPPPPPAPGQPRFYQPGPPGMFDPVPEPQQQAPSNLLSLTPQPLGTGGIQQQQTNVEAPNYMGASNQQLSDAAMRLGQQFNAQPTSAGGAMSMLNQAMGGAQPLRSMGSQELMNAARGEFGVARRQPPRMMPGGGGRQFDPAPAPQRQPGLFNYLNLFSGG